MKSWYDQFAVKTSGSGNKNKSFYDQFTVQPSGKTGGSYYDQFTQGGGASNLERTAKANQSKLDALAANGRLQDFQQYQEAPTMLGRAWERTKELGSGALDVLQRGEYASAGIADTLYGGGTLGDAASRVGQELFSGIGDVQGQKETWGQVLRQNVPAYEQWANDHPWVSIGTDLALGITLDPTTYIPGAAVTKAGKKLGNAADAITAPIRATEQYKNIAGTAGRAFDTSYLWKKGGAPRGYDILWGEKQFAKNYASKIRKNIAPAVDEIATWEPEKVKQFVKVMYGDIPFDQAPVEIQGVAGTIKQQLRTMGRRESRYLGKIPDDWLLENYLPNNPRQFLDLMENAGEYVPSGHMRGLSAWKKTFEREKVLRTGDDFLQWLSDVGVSDNDLAEVVTRNLRGRVGQSAGRIRQIRTHTKWINELPSTFRELPNGKYKEWNTILEPGESLWMPAGNLRFFKQSKWDALPSDVRDLLNNGGQLTDDMVKKLDKEMLGVSSKVTAYAVPKEIVEDITKVSTRLGNPNDIARWWDNVLNVFKNTAILSPFFHVRNFVSSGSQNYLADMNPARYADTMKVLTAKNADTVVQGKTIKSWRELMGRWGITGGSFVGQDTAQTGIPYIGKVFSGNRNVGTVVENINRAPLFMDGIIKNMSPIDAAKRVKKFHFDYDELTDIERSFFKRVAPFYTWTRKNIPLQIEMLFNAPEKYRNIAKLKAAIAGDPASQNNPEWWKEQDVWETKFRDDQGNRYAMNVGLPYSDLNQFGRSPMGMTGPAGVAINAINNYDPFMQENISQYPGDTEYGLPSQVSYALKGLVPIIKRYGFDMAEDIPDMWKFMQGEDADFNKAFRGLSKFIGVRLLKQTKEQREKTEVYKLMRQLQNYAKYQNSRQER